MFVKKLTCKLETFIIYVNIFSYSKRKEASQGMFETENKSFYGSVGSRATAERAWLGSQRN